jgi:hypothetical protein
MPEEIALSQQNDLTTLGRDFLNEVRDTVTGRQLEVLEKLLQIEKLPPSKEQLIKMLGISKATWYAWVKDRDFIDILYELIRIKFAGDVLWIAESLTEKAKAGDVAAIRTFFDLVGKREPQKPNNAFQIVIDTSKVR